MEKELQINKIMPLADYRTKNKYQHCVEAYIGEAKELGECDVSNFVDRIPNEYLKTTSSTSSSEDLK